MFNSRQVRRAFCEKPKRRKGASSRRDYDQTTLVLSAIVQVDSATMVDTNDTCETANGHAIAGKHKASVMSEIVTPFSNRQDESAAAQAYAARRARLMSLHDSVLLPNSQEDPLRLCTHYVDDNVTIKRVAPLSRLGCLEAAQKDTIIVPMRRQTLL